MPRVSVIIPVYNAKAYIGQCLRSILSQSLREVEVICIDDGSTDGSQQAISEYMREDGRIILLKQRNMGPAAARNNGIRQARGEYLMFVDADDYLLDLQLLERMYTACRRQQVSICGAFRMIDRNGVRSCAQLHRSLFSDGADGVLVRYADYQYDYHFQSYLYERRMLIAHGVCFPDYRRYEDPVFFVKAMAAAEAFYVLPVEGYCYRAGHKEDVFSDRDVLDIVRGITDNLALSAAHGWKKLHRLLVARMEGGFYGAVMQHMGTCGARLQQELWKATAAVRWDWLEGRAAGEEALLKPLCFAADAAAVIWKEYETYIQKHCQVHVANGWLFPFSEVPPHSRVVLYAAGSMGRCYAKQLRASDYVFVLWVDQHAQELAEGCVKPVGELARTAYDYIVIAVEDAEAASCIRRRLVQMGAAEERIIWKLDVGAQKIQALCAE